MVEWGDNVIRGGRFSPQDWYNTLQKYKVTVWYSAPTAFRMLMGAGDDVSMGMICQRFATY